VTIYGLSYTATCDDTGGHGRLKAMPQYT
jgi:hypothetical protein